MTDDDDDEVHAFPHAAHSGSRHYGMTLRDYFAVHAPAPTTEEIDRVMRQEQIANPHNDSYKPARHTVAEILAILRYRHADAMMKIRGEQP